jgi:hypothetical protein
MSRNDYDPALSTMLDAYTMPPPREGMADRVMAGAMATTAGRPPRRDRRGAWRIARRVAIGTLAAGMVSAAAVASGLLGAAGIRVPVLTAMLAPEPKPLTKPVIKRDPKPVQQALVVTPVVTPVEPSDPGLADPGPLVADPGTRTARMLQRQAERRAFMQAHPELKPVIRQAMQDQRAFVAAHPEVRDLWRMPPAERHAFLADRPDLRDALKQHRAQRRTMIADHPEAAAILDPGADEKRAARRAALKAGMALAPMAAPSADSVPVVGNQADPR